MLSFRRVLITVTMVLCYTFSHHHPQRAVHVLYMYFEFMWSCRILICTEIEAIIIHEIIILAYKGFKYELYCSVVLVCTDWTEIRFNKQTMLFYWNVHHHLVEIMLTRSVCFIFVMGGGGRCSPYEQKKVSSIFNTIFLLILY